MRTPLAKPAWPVWLLAFVLVAPASSPTAATRHSDRRPFADYEHASTVVMAAMDAHGADALKRAIAAHLPDGVTLVLYGKDAAAKTRDRVLADYARFLPPARIRYVTFGKGRTVFWARDSLPVPLVDADGRLSFADTKYWGGFEPDAGVAALFAAPATTYPFRLEGGNLLANHLGDCIVVESRDSNRATDETLGRAFGCRGIVRLPRRGGIGHIDERAQFVNARTIVTDTPEYADALSTRGYTVVRVPRPRDRWQTYVNSLIVNGVVFVPQFNLPTDAEALRTYRDLGFEAIGLDARSLARKGHGLIHCLSRTYPAVPVNPPAPETPRHPFELLP